MRLSLTLLLAALGAGCATRVSQQASARVHVYSDDRITVVSPSALEHLQVQDTKLDAAYQVDVVTGATQALTVDAVSSATRFSERRHQLSAAGTQAFGPEFEVSGGYALSAEPDHVVHVPSVGIAGELFGRMVRATARYQVLVESIGRTDDPFFLTRAFGHRLDLGWTQILTRSLVVTALGTATAWGCDPIIGCFANPYRAIGVYGVAGGLALAERHPAERFTGAGALKLSWALLDTSALHASYRFSGDSWDVTAHTAELAFVTELFSKRLLLRTEARSTLQSSASFYRARYEGNGEEAPVFRTADAELSRLWNVRLQVHLEWALGMARLVGSFGSLWSYYPDFPALPTRHAWMGGLGLDLEL